MSTEHRQIGSSRKSAGELQNIFLRDTFEILALLLDRRISKGTPVLLGSTAFIHRRSSSAHGKDGLEGSCQPSAAAVGDLDIAKSPKPEEIRFVIAYQYISPNVIDATYAFCAGELTSAYRRDRYAADFRAAVEPLAGHLARVVAKRHGGDWVSTFSVEELNCDSVTSQWAYGFIDLRRRGCTECYMLSVSTAGPCPSVCTIEDGEYLVIPDITIDQALDEVTHRLMVNVQKWMVETGPQPFVQSPV